MSRRDELAIFGGEPAVPGPLPPYRAMGEAERAAVLEVIDSDCLSGFYGSWSDKFWGGPKVRAFERAWSERFEVPHVVSVNSATSGLVAAMGAIGIGPGDEVIVPPWTMSATAIAPLFYGGIPVFVDIDADTFCLDPARVEEAITPRTKAIVAVNLFGHPAPLRRLRDIADRHGLALVEDNAQGPLAQEHGRYAGTVGDIGVFSLNYHKHIHTGEGGMCVTPDARLAQRLQMIRNHGENVVGPLQVEDLTNLVGANYRLTELSAAVGIAQLAGADQHVERRQALARSLTRAVQGLEGLTPPKVREGCTHVYYQWALRVDENRLGCTRDQFSRALSAEGFPHEVGYVRPLYLLPAFQRRRAIGRDGFPFTLTSRQYSPGMCPVVERLSDREFLAFETCLHAIDEPTQAALGEAVRKVHAQRHLLAKLP